MIELMFLKKVILIIKQVHQVMFVTIVMSEISVRSFNQMSAIVFMTY